MKIIAIACNYAAHNNLPGTPFFTSEEPVVFSRADSALLKDGMTLVNGGRGQLMNEADFYAELARGRFNAVLDVYHQEPLPADDLLLRLPNVLCTPHNAGSPGIRAYAPFMLRECRRFWNNLPLEGEIEAARNLQMTDERLWKR